MTLHLVSFGKLRLPGSREWADEYRKRLRARKGLTVEETELPDPREGASPAAALAAWLAKKRLSRECVHLLDEGGVNWSTREWADAFSGAIARGAGALVFAIGPADGWDEGSRALAARSVSLGKQTLAHDLARVTLLEQAYRALMLLDGHPYHRA